MAMHVRGLGYTEGFGVTSNRFHCVVLLSMVLHKVESNIQISGVSPKVEAWRREYMMKQRCRQVGKCKSHKDAHIPECRDEVGVVTGQAQQAFELENVSKGDGHARRREGGV